MELCQSHRKIVLSKILLLKPGTRKTEFRDSKYSIISARALLQDAKGNLWVGSNDEGVLCQKADGQSLMFTMEDGLPNNSMRALCEDKDGRIWVGTSSGITCIGKDFKISLPEDDTGLYRTGSV